MKKKVVIVGLGLFLICICVSIIRLGIRAYADKGVDAIYTGTNWVEDICDNPSQTEISYASKTWELISHKTEGIYGKNCSVYFNNMGYELCEKLSSKPRAMYINLLEKDSKGNEDDYIKLYMGYFKNRQITGFKLVKTYVEGLVDSKYDTRGEFYLRTIIPRVSGDKTYQLYHGNKPCCDMDNYAPLYKFKIVIK